MIQNDFQKLLCIGKYNKLNPKTNFKTYSITFFGFLANKTSTNTVL